MEPGDEQNSVDIGIDPVDIGIDPVDIGIASTGGGDGAAGTATSPRDAGNRRSPRRLLALAAVVALAIAITGSVLGSEQPPADETAVPAPTSPPEVLTPFPDPSPTATPTVTIPIVNEGVTRAGAQCRMRTDDAEHNAVIVYVVPDGRTMRGCADGGVLLRDPRAPRRDTLGEVTLSPESLGATLSGLRTWNQNVEGATWDPVSGRRSYRIDLAPETLGDLERLHLIDVPGGTIWIAGRNEEFAPGISESIDALVASVRVEGVTTTPLPDPGGWCAGDLFITKVPDQWFAGEQCQWLNTSSESPAVLACECLPPLWIQPLQISFDADFGFDKVDSDELVAGPEGPTVRVIEGMRRDPNNMDRPVRAVVFDAGVQRVAVYAAKVTEHVLPGHSWQDTLAAQEFLVTNMRFHSQPGCVGGERLIAAVPDGAFVEIEVGAESLGLPSGSAVNVTGCTREGPRGRQLQVQVEARPTVIGWVDQARVDAPDVQTCPAPEDLSHPQGWDRELRGDFDGDGAEDIAYFHSGENNWAANDELHGHAPNIAIFFGNGGHVATTLPTVGTPAVERFAGMGRDAIGMTVALRSGAAWSLLAVDRCALEPLFVGTQLDDGATRSGFCRARSGLTDSLRSWQEIDDPERGWVTVHDQRWGPSTSNGASDRALSARAGAFVCGPELTGRVTHITANAHDAPLTGDHPMSLQWLTSQGADPGTVRFEPTGVDSYKASGRHEARTGELTLIGFFEVVSPDELAFDGTITTRVDRLFGGEPCVRDAGQRFVRRPGTTTFRMRDRINCDGARTDWIDITIPTALLAED